MPTIIIVFLFQKKSVNATRPKIKIWHVNIEKKEIKLFIVHDYKLVK